MVGMCFRLWPLGRRQSDRRKSTVDEREQWAERRRDEQQREHDDVLRRLRYLELQANILMRKEP